MNIKGKFVTLRAMTHDDMPMIVDMFNDPEMEKAVVGWSFPLSIEQQSKWFDNHMNDQLNFRFVIETPDEGAVGIATLTDIDWKNRHATHGIKLTKSTHKKGVGTDAVMAIMRYAFDELNLHRLNGSVFEYNTASRALYSGKLGWREEGVKREYVFKNGKYHDLIITGILAEDYYQIAEKLQYWD